MDRFCQGDAQAFDGLFQRYAPAVHGYLLKLVGDRATAEDLAQATFLSLVKSRGRFAKGSPFKPWLYAIATNAARDSVRRRKPEDLTSDGELPRDAPAENAGPSDVGLDRRVREALATLPDNQREVIILNRFEGLSMAEIAVALGASESAVKVRAHRGYERLREQLHDLWEELQ